MVYQCRYGIIYIVLVTILLWSAAVESRNERRKRVVGGYDVVKPGYACSWPYIVIVEKTCRDVNFVNERIPYRCSGSIIDKDFVLTAKQCV